MPRAVGLEVRHLSHENHPSMHSAVLKITWFSAHSSPTSPLHPNPPRQGVYIHRPHTIDCSASDCMSRLDPARPSGVHNTKTMFAVSTETTSQPALQITPFKDTESCNIILHMRMPRAVGLEVSHFTHHSHPSTHQTRTVFRAQLHNQPRASNSALVSICLYIVHTQLTVAPATQRSV